MDSELPGIRDWDSLHVFLPAADRVTNVIKRIWQASESQRRTLCVNTAYPVEFSTEYGCVWIFRYLSRPDLLKSKAYLAVGVRYPGVTTTYGNDIAEDGAPYLFVELGAEKECDAIDELGTLSSWGSDNSFRINTISLRNLPTDLKEFALKAKKWVDDRVSQVAAAIRAA